MICKRKGKVISQESCRICSNKTRCDELDYYGRLHHNSAWVQEIILVSSIDDVSCTCDDCDCSKKIK